MTMEISIASDLSKKTSLDFFSSIAYNIIKRNKNIENIVLFNEVI